MRGERRPDSDWVGVDSDGVGDPAPAQYRMKPKKTMWMTVQTSMTAGVRSKMVTSAMYASMLQFCIGGQGGERVQGGSSPLDYRLPASLPMMAACLHTCMQRPHANRT
jgi:hypothetical protein